MSLKEFLNSFGGIAFGASRVHEAIEIYSEALRENSHISFGLAGAMVPAGLRTMISDLIYDNMIHSIVITGANAVHDVLEALKLPHYHDFEIGSDEALREAGLNRIFDVFVPDSHFQKLEEFLRDVFSDLPEKTDFIEVLRKIAENLDDRNSILRAAYESEALLLCPGLMDSMIGLHFWLSSPSRRYVDVTAELRALSQRIHEAERNGAIFIGGGLPKNFILQSMLISSKDGFDYAIQITTDSPQWGGLSGATLEEAKSWGKVKKSARCVTVYGDATIVFPLIVAGLRIKMEE
ncbi:MAG: deoxyhypusine synthase [Archaeoglobi archaeon]|nr:deoxyhypusine synthase [Archaeoglobi archaeon]